MPFACSIVARRPNALQAVVFGKALQGDVDRALQLLGGGVDDVGEDAALGRLADVRRVTCRQQGDHGAGGLANDLLDQLERMFRGEAEPDERDVGMLSRRHRADLLDVDRVGDHFVPEPGDDLGEQCEPVVSLVGDQDAEVLDSVLSHRPIVTGETTIARGRNRAFAISRNYGGLRYTPLYGVFHRVVVGTPAVWVEALGLQMIRPSNGVWWSSGSRRNALAGDQAQAKRMDRW